MEGIVVTKIFEKKKRSIERLATNFIAANTN